MGRRPTKRKSSPADVLIKPEPAKAVAASPGSPDKSGGDSPNEFDFNFNKLKSSSSVKKENDGGSAGGATASIFLNRGGGLSPLKGVNTIADLKDFASSQIQSMKQQLERSQSEIMKDMEASQSRLQKRFKMHSQGSQQVIDEAEREYKNLCDRIGDSQEAMKAAFTEFIAEAQSNAHVCKTALPEIFQSFENTIDSLRSRYGISSTSAC